MLFKCVYLLSLTSAVFAQSGGYLNSCSGCNIGYSNTNHIYAYCSSCRNNNGGSNSNPPPSILLNNCFGNFNGLCAYQRNGGFDQSCLLQTQGETGSVMKVYCNGGGKTYLNTINLNDYIGNTNGGLVC